MAGKTRVVHYLNQFFGQAGGEEKADLPPQGRAGPVGPGLALKEALGESFEVAGTVICGDNYFNQQLERASAEVLGMIKEMEPQMVAVGPAFNAGRYGIACGAVAKKVVEELGVPVVGGMFPENPGVEMYRRYFYIVKTGATAAGMRSAISEMARLLQKLARGEELGGPEEEGYLPRGIRINVWHEQRGAARAVYMLRQLLQGEAPATEYPMPEYDRVAPALPVKNLRMARLALVTSGGIVPCGNPDRIESSSASRFGRYSLEGIDDLKAGRFQTVHGGYDPTYANEDPDRVLPLDMMRQLEREGIIGSLHQTYYATVGNGTSVANARTFGEEIAGELKAAGVDGVILTST